MSTKPPVLPRLNSSVGPASPVVSLNTATGANSPGSPLSEMPRSKTKRMDRVKGLLTPIKGSLSPTRITPKPVAAVPETGSSTALDTDEHGLTLEEARGPEGAMRTGSKIEFFERHPEDSTNPLTFLGGSSDGGTGDTGPIGVEKRDETQQGESSSADSFPSVFYTPPQERDYLAYLADHSDNEGSPPIPILRAPRVLTGDGRVRPRVLLREHKVNLHARPMTLHELPGRFRSTECCWYCSDGVTGERCKVCGLTVRKASPERYGK
ncbi:MAG: hypothetical protein Q9166_002600 [cf. Caloplaca sp. 2 TL-2023]